MLKLTVVTPEKKILTDVEVDDITLPGYRGELNILEGHASLMTTLTPGAVRFRRKGSQQTEQVSVSWGYCEVVKDVFNVLAETAESKFEIDLSRAEEALKKSEKMLESEVDPTQMEKFRLKRERALVRISVARMNQ